MAQEKNDLKKPASRVCFSYWIISRVLGEGQAVENFKGLLVFFPLLGLFFLKLDSFLRFCWVFSTFGKRLALA